MHIKAGLWPLSLCPRWIMFMIKCVRKAPYQTCRITLLTAVLLLPNVIPHSSCQRHGHQIFSINWDPYDDPCMLRMSVWNASELVSSPEISNGCETSLSHDSSDVSRNTHTHCSIGSIIYTRWYYKWLQRKTRHQTKTLLSHSEHNKLSGNIVFSMWLKIWSMFNILQLDWTKVWSLCPLFTTQISMKSVNFYCLKSADWL